jgi:RNA polymerase sigma factor (sigma-70 family)
MTRSAGQSDSSQAAVAEALAEHGRWLRTVLAARGVERGSLDEVMQQAATAALDGAGRLRDCGRVGAWLYRIAVTQALLHRRRSGRRRKLATRFAESGVAPCEAVDQDPLAWLLVEEEQQLVRRALAAMPPRDAEILLLKYTEDWTYRQLAEQLGTTESAIEARLHRARARLRSTLMKLAPALVPQH